MAVRGIFKYLQEARLTTEGSIVKARTQAGLQVSQRRGPTLYSWNVTVGQVLNNSDAYGEITDQLLENEYGVDPFKSSMPGNITNNRGTWGGTPMVNQSTPVNGKVIICDAGTSSTVGYGRTGDWVQFAGDDKVYRLTADADTNSTGQFTLRLDSPLIQPSINNAVITHGIDVEFKGVLESIPIPRIRPSGYSDAELVNFGRSTFREVI